MDAVADFTRLHDDFGVAFLVGEDRLADEQPAGFQHPRELRQRLLDVVHEGNHVVDVHDVKCRIADAGLHEVFRVGDAEFHVRLLQVVLAPRMLLAVFRVGDVARRPVDADDMPALPHLRRKLVHALAAAAADVEHALARHRGKRHAAHRREAELVCAVAVVLVDGSLIGKRHLAHARITELDFLVFVIRV